MKRIKKFLFDKYHGVPEELLFIKISPRVLDEKITKKHKDRYLNKFIVGGDWDTSTVPFNSIKLYKNISILYNGGDIYNIEGFSKHFMKRINTGYPFNYNGKILDTKEKVLWYAEYCISLMESIKKGYDFDSPGIGIAIGKGSKLLKSKDGRHRLIISQILNVPLIKCKITNIHINNFTHPVKQKKIIRLLSKIKTIH